MVGSHSGRRPSNARAPCQQNAHAAIRSALPMPMVKKFWPAARNMNNAEVPPPRMSDALHHANQVEARFFHQNAANNAPRMSLMKRPNSRTVKESIGMIGWGAFANRRVV
jgi:hypothetical protein